MSAAVRPQRTGRNRNRLTLALSAVRHAGRQQHMPTSRSGSGTAVLQQNGYDWVVGARPRSGPRPNCTKTLFVWCCICVPSKGQWCVRNSYRVPSKGVDALFRQDHAAGPQWGYIKQGVEPRR
ncbi:hypothetical protein HaLaN_16923, partial [Haematococcus lacustris]